MNRILSTILAVTIAATAWCGNGSLESPYLPSEARTLALSGDAPDAPIYIKGAISLITKKEPSYGSVTYYISDDGQTRNQMEVYRGLGLGGEPITTDNYLAVGDELVIYGVVKLQYGAPQVDQGSIIISLNGTDAPEPVVELATYLTDGIDSEWEYQNVTIPSGFDSIWTWDDAYGCLKGSAYKSSGTPPTSESYIFRFVDLEFVTDASISFEHAGKYQSTLRELCYPVIRICGSKTWRKLEVANWPSKSNWNFVNSGDIDISLYDGKKVEIGFRYASSSAGADIWEIKNLTLKGRDTHSGIEAVEADKSDAMPIEYYNLQGVKIANPGSGIYIMKRGNKVSKVLLR